MKIKIFVLFLLFFCMTVFLGNYYRPYVYSNKINDYGLADVGYNIIAVVNMSLLSWLGFYKFTKNKIIDICINTGFYLFFELLSYKLSLFGVFDIKDCYALIFSGLLSLVFLYFLDKQIFMHSKNQIYSIFNFIGNEKK